MSAEWWMNTCAFRSLKTLFWGGSSNGASESSDSKANVWQLFFKEGNIRMYRRELEREGRVIDPLKAVHVVRGIGYAYR